MEKIVTEYVNTGCSIQYLSKKYQKTPMTISKAITNAGYSVINRQNIVKIDENIFDNIDTEEKAYWLGFIYADGCLNTRDYSFEMTLSAKDKDHLERFNNFIKHTRPNKLKMVKQFKSYRCYFHSKHFWKTLFNYGCTPRKSLTLKFPKIEIFSDMSLIRHFLRGYFDGDGCITHGNKEHTRMTIKICGTNDFLNSFQLYLPLKRHHKILQTKTTPVLHMNDGTAYKICKYLYQDSTVYLDRKYKLFKKYCRLYEEL